jgi:pSer/pThr/pTyr-binding forkhead associated (FHA) protein
MKIRLICREGPLQGQEFVAKDSFQIGRSSGDLQVKDPKASSPHAKILSDSNGLMVIEDLGSSNGTWVNGVKIAAATNLQSGDKITIGKTILEVVLDEQKETQSSKGSWQEKLELAFDKAAAQIPGGTRPAPISRPFEAPVILDFAQGIQTGQTLVFGFGPRAVGRHCSEGLLFDEAAPPVAFELYPADACLCELRARTEQVRVNGAPVKAQKLKSGDRISIGQTVIVIRAFSAT